MHTQTTRWLVVSDLDGTLLDDQYDLPAAASAIDDQAARGRIVALASSKTLEEMQALAELCRQRPILLFENGAGIAWPVDDGSHGNGYRSEITGEGYAELRGRLRALRRRSGYRFLGFGDLSALEVSRLTGLSSGAARLARHRAVSEPVMWLDTAQRLAEFERTVAGFGYRVVQGGRFHHVMPPTDKSCGLRRVARRLDDSGRNRLRVVACGDSPNDLAMLQAADLALVFPRPDGSYLEVPDAAGVDVGIRVPATGSTAWGQALDSALRSATRASANSAGRPPDTSPDTPPLREHRGPGSQFHE